MLQHARAFALLPCFSDDIPRMVTYTARHEQGVTASIVNAASFNRDVMPYWAARMPAGARVIQARWVLVRETDGGYGGSLMKMLQRGRYDVGPDVRMLRPVAKELRRQGLTIDAIFTDNEGGWPVFNITHDQMRAIYSSARIRSRMPPAVRSIPVDRLLWSTPTFDYAAAHLWNTWQADLLNQAMRDVFINSRLFHAVRGPGEAPTGPIVNNFNWCNPARTAYDDNGWPFSSVTPIDGVTSNWGQYFGGVGGRYRGRTHDVKWNQLIDFCNIARACLAGPGRRFWPTVVQPIRNNPWLWERMIAHLTRTGVNWTATKSAFVYFNEREDLGPQADPLAAQILARHDQPFPVQRNLPEVPLDSDTLETAGYVTTYAEFLDNVEPTPLTDAGGWRDDFPVRVFPSSPVRVAV